MLKRKQKKTLLIILMFPLLITGMLCSIINQNNEIILYACTTTDECQREITEAQHRRQKLRDDQKSLEQKSSDTETQIKNIIQQIENFEIEITAVNIQITNLEAQHNQLAASITEKTEIIKSRMIETQLSYETNAALNFIASSSSITDMIERVQVMDSITEADQKVIYLLDVQRQEIKKNEENQKDRQAELGKLVEEQQALQKSKEVELAAYLAEAAKVAEAQVDALRDEQLSQAQLASIERAKATVPTITSGTALQNEKAAFAYFVNQGFTKEAAAGIIGNFYVESGMDPNKAQYGGGPGRGLGQWGYGDDGSRYNQLLAWAAKNNISPTALGTQLAWTVKEIIAYGMEPTMKSITDIATATEYFGRKWERPACLACSIRNRIDYAKQAYARNA
ncbi:MAG: phage tail tip lysozyme [Culicoidibacterales bacterium]